MANQSDGGAPAPPAPTSRASGHPTQRRVTRPKVRASTPPPRRIKTRVTSPGNSYRSQSIKRRATSSNSNRGNNNPAPRKPAASSAKRIVPPAPPKPVIPDTNAYLKSDSVYQRQLAAYAKSLADFQADQGLARTDYDTGYQSTSRDIGLAKTEAQGDLKDDFASRGMLQSSLYNQGLGELNTQYQNQFNDLSKQRTSFLDQITQEMAKYKNEQSSQSNNAMQEALRRRAEKYNL